MGLHPRERLRHRSSTHHRDRRIRRTTLNFQVRPETRRGATLANGIHVWRERQILSFTPKSGSLTQRTNLRTWRDFVFGSSVRKRIPCGTTFASVRPVATINEPITSGWQRCPKCLAVGWITRQVTVKGDRLSSVWKCSNCRHEWPIGEQNREPA